MQLLPANFSGLQVVVDRISDEVPLAVRAILVDEVKSVHACPCINQGAYNAKLNCG